MNCERSRVFQEPDYLLDKFYASMLSGMEAEGQGQSARTDDAVPLWECVKGDIEERGDPSFPLFTKNVKVGRPRRNCISSLAVVGRDKDENPGVGGMSPHLYKERKGGPATTLISGLDSAITQQDLRKLGKRQGKRQPNERRFL